MVIDNFNIIYNRLLGFDKPGDFYLILILKRRKDFKEVVDGVNEDNRMIKHYFVYSVDYLKQKEAAIKRLCEDNDARAYILPQRRFCPLVMRQLAAKCIAMIDSVNTHFDHLIRSVVAGCHNVDPARKNLKRWVVDIDIENLEVKTRDCLDSFVKDVVESISDVIKMFKSGNPNDIIVVPTTHGAHIITPPFNRGPDVAKTIFRKGFDASCIKEDAMALLYHSRKED